MKDLKDKLAEKNSIFDGSHVLRGYRDGVEIEKGIILNEKYIMDNFKEIGDLLSYFTAYPDCFLDLIKPEDSNFKLFFYQRIMLRAIMRFKTVYVTACRAFSKSFLTILALFLQCVFMPGTKRFLCMPQKTQGAQVGREKLTEIFQRWPLLRREVIGGEVSDTPGNYGKDYITLRFRNGSVLDLVGALESSLGGRRQGGLIDEIKLHDEEMINTVVLPLLNVSRRLPDNTVNPKEPNQQVISCTSAWLKTTFAYDKLIDDFELSIIEPETAFVFGCDYRVPMMHGLLDKDFITKLKLSPSYNENSFAREYLSIWSGSSEESWFNFDKMSKYRVIKNPENHAKNVSNSKQFYLLSVDVGRLNDQTVCCVFRVNPDSTGKYRCTLVNLYVLARQSETKTFTQQCIDIKRLIKEFQPREVIIDTNGLGIGLADEMIKEQYDKEGNYYPPYGFKNDDEFKKIQPKGAEQILVGIKANGPLNSKIHSNAYARISSGLVHFLIKEQEAKAALLSTQKGQKMSMEQKIKRLMPHEMTSRLFDEMANLRLKKSSTSQDIALEQINARYPKDKYSSFAYGLWRIKELEEEEEKKKKRRARSNIRQLTFFS